MAGPPRRQARIQFQQRMSLVEFQRSFGTEAQCAAALEAACCPDGFACPRCGSGAHCQVRHEGRQLSQGKTGQLPFPVETMLRIRFLQPRLVLCDPAMEEALHDVPLYTSRRIGTWKLAQALAEAGLEIAVSCDWGRCGTSHPRVSEGTSEHRHVYLTPENLAAGPQITPCCQRLK